MKIFDLFGASDHQCEVDDVEDPENPVNDILFNEVLERYHSDKDEVNECSHDESLSSEPVVVSFTVVVFNLIGAIFL